MFRLGETMNSKYKSLILLILAASLTSIFVFQINAQSNNPLNREIEGTIEDSTSTNSVISGSNTNHSVEFLFSLLLIPMGVMSSIIIISQKKNNKENPEEEFGVEDFPKLLGGLLAPPQNEEENNSDFKKYDTKNCPSYIC